VLYNRAVYFHRIGNFKAAATQLEKFNAKRSTRKGLLALSLMCMLLEQNQKAIKYLKTLVLRHPNDLVVRFNLGLACQRESEEEFDRREKTLHRVQKAIEVYRRCNLLNDLIFKSQALLRLH
jgi:hypothetical protein